MSTDAQGSMSRRPHIDRTSAETTPATRIALAAATAIVVLTFAFWLGAGTPGGAAAQAVMVGSAVVIAVSLVAAGALRTGRSSEAAAGLDFTGLAAVVDAERERGCLRRPMAVAVIELRGIAADTVVDGADAWSEPVAVIAKRLTQADLPSPARVARLGPHGFGAVFSTPTRADAVAVAQTLVALCRIPIQTPVREIRVDAVAGVCHADAGLWVRGEELLRTADASMRVDATSAGPVAMAGERLRRHARRVVEVETEIRHNLDVDLLTARLAPVVDVHSDRVVGLRSAYDWTAVSATEPEMLRSIAGSLGLRRSIETQYLMRSISAAEALGGSDDHRIHARIEAARVVDDRAVAQLDMLIQASGVDPAQLVLELDGWGVGLLGSEAVSALSTMGVGFGVALRHHSTWERIPPEVVDHLDSVSVSATDLVDEAEVSALRVSRLARVVGGDLSKVIVFDVDSASVALELSASGLPVQSGRVHGRPLAAHDLNVWLSQRLESGS